MQLVFRAAAEGAQLLIATHSPMLLACPDARIFSFDEPPVRNVRYEDLEHVAVMREPLSDPRRFLASSLRR